MWLTMDKRLGDRCLEQCCTVSIALGKFLCVSITLLSGALREDGIPCILCIGASVGTPEVHWWTRQAGCGLAQVAG